MKKKIIFIVGKSGSGKSTLEKKLVELEPKVFNKVISETTRKPRADEIDGKDYYFVSPEDFFNNPKIESIEFDKNHYGISLSSLNFQKDNIIVAEPTGVYQIVKYIKDTNLDIEPVLIYINISVSKCIDHMTYRGDNETKIRNRLKNDNVDILVNNLDILELIDKKLIIDKDNQLNEFLVYYVLYWLNKI